MNWAILTKKGVLASFVFAGLVGTQPFVAVTTRAGSDGASYDATAETNKYVEPRNC